MATSSKRPQLGSCRSGSVVHLLSATGAQVPVRLAITSRDEATGDKPSHRHIVKVQQQSVAALLLMHGDKHVSKHTGLDALACLAVPCGQLRVPQQEFAHNFIA